MLGNRTFGNKMRGKSRQRGGFRNVSNVSTEEKRRHNTNNQIEATAVGGGVTLGAGV